MKNLAIYDSKCYYCNLMVEFIRKLDKNNLIFFISYYSKRGQRILNKQFGSKIGFTFYLFDLNEMKVYWGDAATLKVLKIVKFPDFIAKLFSKFYPIIVEIISYAIKRHRMICPPSEGKCKFIKTSEGEFSFITKFAYNEINKIWN